MVVAMIILRSDIDGGPQACLPNLDFSCKAETKDLMHLSLWLRATQFTLQIESLARYADVLDQGEARLEVRYPGFGSVRPNGGVDTI
jgi:hypothetical protein